MVEYFVTKGKLVVRNGAPLVVLDGEEKTLSQVEFVLWTSLHWNVLNKETLKAEFDRRMRKYNLSLDVSFEQTLNRLKTRELIVGKSDYLAVDALYNLVKDLYVVPLGTVNKFKKAIMFLYMFFIQGIPLDKCRETMCDFELKDIEKQIQDLNDNIDNNIIPIKEILNYPILNLSTFNN